MRSSFKRHLSGKLAATAVILTLFAGGCTGSSSKNSEDTTAATSAPPVSQSVPPSSSSGNGSSSAPGISLSASTLVVDEGGNVNLTWNASDVDSCTASGGWSGTLSASGSQNVGPLSVGTTFSLSCTGPGGTALEMISVAVVGPVQLSWVAPDENVDGSTLLDLAGYRIYFGVDSRSYSDMVELSAPSATSHTLSLVSGDYYVAMTALDADGNESGYSNEVIKTAL